MAYISLMELKSNKYLKYNPDWITFRSTKLSKNRYNNYLNIPRQISTKAGIDFGTRVDLQYDSDRNLLRIQLTKEMKGFKVRAQNHTGKFSSKPPDRIVIQFPSFKEFNVSPLKKPVLISQYDINQGIVLHLPDEVKNG